MNNKTASCLAVSLILALLAGDKSLASSIDHSKQVKKMPQSQSETKTMIASTQSFGLDLFQKLSQENPRQNCFISPTSVAIALNFAMAGARGTTRQAMAAALKLPKQEDTAKAFSALMNELESKDDPGVEFNIANALFVQHNFKLNDEFLKTAKDDFQSEVKNEDFAKPEAIQQVNAWVSEKTRGHIPTIVEKLSPETVAVLLNAIYFHGKWTKPFEPKSTRYGQFHLESGATKKVPLMNRSGKFNYMEESDFQAVALPYGSERYSAYIFLPAQTVNLSDFQKKLTAENWDKWMENFRPYDDGNLSLPKFHIDFGHTLNATLSHLGFADIFSNHADFSGIHTPPPGIKVSQVIHKTTLDVDEQGTVATAATGVVFMPPAVRMDVKRFSMIVDRPFIFAIRDEKTGMLLFIGSVYEPAQIKH